MEDALVKFVKSGKLSFADLANAIIDDLVRIAVRQAELGIVLAVGSAFAPSPAPAASAGQSYSNISTSTAANGNVITRDGVMPLERFAKGGVVDRAHVAIFGEAGAEAFVPLPDGRSIPVSMKGASGGGNVSVIVNVNMADGTEKTAGSNDGQMLGKAIAAAVKAELINQKRPGGLLA
jgi:lambda family phage tail tape measure protein